MLTAAKYVNPNLLMSAKKRDESTALIERELIAFALRKAEIFKGEAIRQAIPGVTEHDISRWKKAPDSSLTGEKKRAIMRAAEEDEREREGLIVGGVGDSVGESPEEAFAVTFPKTPYLKPFAQDFYDRTLGKWAQQWTSATLAAAAHELVRFFETEALLAKEGGGRRPELTEDEQLLVLQREAARVERNFGRRGAG